MNKSMKIKTQEDKVASVPVGPGRLFINIDQVRPDPDQPRKKFDQAKLQELADSIKEQGIIQDLIVRLRPAPTKLLGPDLIDKEWRVIEGGKETFRGTENMARIYAGADNLVDGYEIVDGERRWRAAKLAGLDKVPVAVREVSANVKLSLQVVANQQRENLTALDEAAAYRKEIESGRHTAESLYKSLGISRGTLFSRLALNRLQPTVRAALESGKISVSVAGLVSMIPGKKGQEEFVEDASGDEWSEPMSFREAQELLERDYCRSLKGAPFKLDEVYEGGFVEDGAGPDLKERGACNACAFRTGNMPEASGFKNPNVCTRPKCFEAKGRVASKQAIAKAEEAGRRVLPEKEGLSLFTSWQPETPRSESKYMKLDEVCYDDKRRRTFKEILGKSAPEPVMALNPNQKLVPVYEKETVAKLLEEKGLEAGQLRRKKVNGSGDDKKREELRKRGQKAAELAMAVVLEKVRKAPTEKLLRLLALKMCYTSPFLKHHKIGGDEDKGRGAIADFNAWMAKRSEEDLKADLAQAEWCDPLVDYWNGEFGDQFEALCEAYKVDPKKYLEQVKAEEKAAKTKTKKGAK
jgi:ParB/RepB/Spo0J family partition protein